MSTVAKIILWMLGIAGGLAFALILIGVIFSLLADNAQRNGRNWFQ